ncbi:MAG: hypothetical protein PVJ76_20170, partial [Gemmatimonadota bacterium]
MDPAVVKGTELLFHTIQNENQSTGRQFDGFHLTKNLRTRSTFRSNPSENSGVKGILCGGRANEPRGDRDLRDETGGGIDAGLEIGPTDGILGLWTRVFSYEKWAR